MFYFVENNLYLQIYYVLVRLLRLADRVSTAESHRDKTGRVSYVQVALTTKMNRTVVKSNQNRSSFVVSASFQTTHLDSRHCIYTLLSSFLSLPFGRQHKANQKLPSNQV